MPHLFLLRLLLVVASKEGVVAAAVHTGRALDLEAVALGSSGLLRHEQSAPIEAAGGNDQLGEFERAISSSDAPPSAASMKVIESVFRTFQEDYQKQEDALLYTISGLVYTFIVAVFFGMTKEKQLDGYTLAAVSEMCVIFASYLLFIVLSQVTGVYVSGADQLILEMTAGKPSAASFVANFAWFYAYFLGFNIKYRFMARENDLLKAFIGKVGTYTMAFLSMHAWGNVMGTAPWNQSPYSFFAIVPIFILFAWVLRYTGNLLRGTQLGSSWMEEDTMIAWTTGYMFAQFLRYLAEGAPPSLLVIGGLEHQVSCSSAWGLLTPWSMLPICIMALEKLRGNLHDARDNNLVDVIMWMFTRSWSITFVFLSQSFFYWFCVCDETKITSAAQVRALAFSAAIFTPFAFIAAIFLAKLNVLSLAEAMLTITVVFWANLGSRAYQYDFNPTVSSDTVILDGAMSKFLLCVLILIVWGTRILPGVLAGRRRVVEAGQMHHDLEEKVEVVEGALVYDGTEVTGAAPSVPSSSGVALSDNPEPRVEIEASVPEAPSGDAEEAPPAVVPPVVADSSAAPVREVADVPAAEDDEDF